MASVNRPPVRSRWPQHQLEADEQLLRIRKASLDRLSCRASRIVSREQIDFEGSEEHIRRIRKLREHRLAHNDDQLVLDDVSGGTNYVLELIALHT